MAKGGTFCNMSNACPYFSDAPRSHCGTRPARDQGLNRPCLFPFIYEGVEYDGCTDAYHKDMTHREPWCPYELDTDMHPLKVPLLISARVQLLGIAAVLLNVLT